MGQYHCTSTDGARAILVVDRLLITVYRGGVY